MPFRFVVNTLSAPACIPRLLLMTKGKGAERGLGFLGFGLSAAPVSKHSTARGAPAAGSFHSNDASFLRVNKNTSGEIPKSSWD